MAFARTKSPVSAEIKWPSATAICEPVQRIVLAFVTRRRMPI